jgi:hypothetical protein
MAPGRCAGSAAPEFTARTCRAIVQPRRAAYSRMALSCIARVFWSMVETRAHRPARSMISVVPIQNNSNFGSGPFDRRHTKPAPDSSVKRRSWQLAVSPCRRNDPGCRPKAVAPVLRRTRTVPFQIRDLRHVRGLISRGVFVYRRCSWNCRAISRIAAGALWSPLRRKVESVTSRRWWGSPSRSSSRHATDGS